MGGLAPGQLKSRRGWHSSPRRLHYRFSFFDRVSRTHCWKNSINFAGMAHSHRHRLAAAWPSLVRQIGPVLRRRRHFNLFAHLSVLDNLTIAPIKLRGVPRDVAARKALDLLRMVGLGEKASNFPDELSRGQKQRVAIARCLAMEPEIVLFDEPTSALDPTMVSEVLAVIHRLARDGMTMVIVTHEMDFARDISSRAFYMDEGCIYESGTSVQVFEAPQRNKTRAFIHRIRSFHRQITSVDFDVYALNAEVEQFGERQFLSRDERHDLVLLVEELILLHRGRLGDGVVDLTISHSEKSRRVEIVVGAPAGPVSPLDVTDNYGLGASIVRGLSESIDYHLDNGR